MLFYLAIADQGIRHSYVYLFPVDKVDNDPCSSSKGKLFSPPPLPESRKRVAVFQDSFKYTNMSTLLDRKHVLVTGFPVSVTTSEVESFIASQLDSSVITKLVNFDDWTGEAVVNVISADGTNT